MLRAEFVKMKRTTLFWMHILVPIVGTGIVLWYYKRLGALDMNVKSIGEFLEILSLAFPTLSGIVCALGTEMEVDAGNMQVLLGGVAGKCRAGGVKLVALLLLGAMGTLLALGSYLVGIYLYSGESFSGELLLFTVESVFILLGTQIATYVIHFFVSLKWHKGVVIGAGIVESMLSALFLTGMGEGIWMYCPFAWGTQLLRYMIYYKEKFIMEITSDLRTGVWMSAGMTVAFLTTFFVWFSYYEGKKEVE